MIEYVVKNEETGQLEMKPVSYIAGQQDSFPIGMVTPFAGANAPEGWLICDGSEVSKTQYKGLYDVIGDLYGTATNPGNFMLPNLKETVPVGVGEGQGAAHDAVTLGEFKDDQIQDHYHSYGNVGGTYGPLTYQAGSGVNIYTNNRIASGRSGTTTHGKILGMNYIIKF